MKKLKIDNIKTIDAHCHPFNPLLEGSEDLRLDFNLYHLGAELDNVVNSLTSKKIIEELRVILGLSNDFDDKEIINHRNNLYKKNPKEYIKKSDFKTIIIRSMENTYSDYFPIIDNLYNFIDNTYPELSAIADAITHLNPISDPEILKFIHGTLQRNNIGKGFFDGFPTA